MSAEKILLTSESVTEGHPDKLCDQNFGRRPGTRFTPKTRWRAWLARPPRRPASSAILGEITTTAYFDAQAIARETIRKIGYTDSKYCLDYKTTGIWFHSKSKSPDIAQGVNDALEVRGDGAGDPIDKNRGGDQGMMIGFACNETPEYMPLTISLAHQLVKRLAAVRRDGSIPI